ncbi:MAG: peptide chain release factor 2 [bacterium]
MQSISEIKQNFSNLQTRISAVSKKKDPDNLDSSAEAIKILSGDPTFWNNNLKAQQKMKELGRIQAELNGLKELQGLADDISTMLELIQDDENASASELEETLQETTIMVKKLAKVLDKAELETYLGNKYDKYDAIFSLHSGQGGTEANDWTEMLSRMYLRFFEKAGFNVEIIHKIPGNEAGINTITMEVHGQYAYGYLKREHGTHRLVRVSPFNAQGLRQTSFSGVEVTPLIEDDLEVDLKEEDIEFAAVRSSGAGGQNVNKVATSVRLIHTPSGITVSCSTERSQLRNRELAMNVLRGKLFAIAETKRQAEESQLKGDHKIAGWGNQIRNYVLQPYKLVKDLRTGIERTDPENILDGDLDELISAEIRL